MLQLRPLPHQLRHRSPQQHRSSAARTACLPRIATISRRPARPSRVKRLQTKSREVLNMPDNAEIDFDAPATLRKWPSVNKERVSAALGARPYMIIDGTLDECIRKFMAMPVGQHHLYEIHTAAQSDLVSAVLSAAHIVELARLRDFL